MDAPNDLTELMRKAIAGAIAEALSADNERDKPPVDDAFIDDLVSMVNARVNTRRMPRWSVVRLEWDNMMKYGEDNVVDFGLLTGTMIGITAPNDGGKSSLVDILTFAIYGESPRADKRAIERVGACPTDRSWTSVWLRAGESMYRVDREIKNGRSLSVRVYAAPAISSDAFPRGKASSFPRGNVFPQKKINDFPQWSIQSWGNISQTQQRLSAVVGDIEMFKSIALSSPGDVNICNCDYSDRLKLFAHLFGFSGDDGDNVVGTVDVGDQPLQSRRDVLRGELIGIQGTMVGNHTMGMTADEIEWLEAKYAAVNSAEIAAKLRAQLKGVRARDAVLVHTEYVEATSILRDAIQRVRDAGFKWNPMCRECTHNRELCGGVDVANPHTADIESLSADRDRLAAEYAVCRRVDWARLELAYAEKHIAWTAMKRLAAGVSRVEEINAEIAEIDRSLYKNEVFHKIVQDGVVAGVMCEWYIGRVIAGANAILERLCGGEFALSAEFTTVGPPGLKLVVRDAGRGVRIPVELGGGFQRFACGLAIRAAIAGHNGGPAMLIVDEGFDCMDVVNRFRCIDVFPELTKIFDNTVVVSHLENIKGACGATLAIQSIGGLARIKNTPRQVSVPEKNRRK